MSVRACSADLRKVPHCDFHEIGESFSQVANDSSVEFY